MRFTRIVGLFLALAVPCAAFAQQSKKPRRPTQTIPAPRTSPQRSALGSPTPPRMSPEKAFYYFVAMYGFGRVLRYGGPDDAIEIYGKTFDASNYERAMADEFERNRYRERIRAKIIYEVSKVDFNEKFTFVAQATLAEYSFGSHSFPFVPNMFQGYRLSIGPPNHALLVVTGFRLQDAVNGSDFNWSLPMTEADASTFVKSRSTAAPGNVDRRVAIRITYSVVNKNGQLSGTNFIGEYSHPIFSPFVYSVEVYADESLSRKLGVIPKINTLGASTAEELRLATVAAQTATTEVGKYRNMIDYRNKSGQVIYYGPHERREHPQLFGTVTLTDVGVTLFDEQPNVSPVTKSFNFFDSPATTLYRANGPRDLYVGGDEQEFSVHWARTVFVSFETRQERDRFFVDLSRAFREWKTKYAPFQFAAGKLTIEQRCLVNTYMVPCTETTISEGKPVWQTPTYRVTVESLERKANNYIATLVFENLTDEAINIGWQKKSNLLPDAVGPYLIDERGEKYFALGTDSGNIIVDGMIWIWKSHTGILPKTKLTSRFMFSGNGEGKIFTLKAEGIEDLASRPITIEGLRITSPGN